MRYIRNYNTVKIILTIIMLCFISIIFFSACNKEDIKTENEVPAVTEYKDLDGATFIFVTGWPDEYNPEVVDSVVSDSVIKRYADVREKLNCDFQVITIGAGITHNSYLIQAFASGNQVPDLIDIHAQDAFPQYKAGLLLPFEEISTIDINDERWGPKALRRFGIFNGLSYGMLPYDWGVIPQCAGALLSNNGLINTVGITPTPYELQEKGEWNWDNFYKILEQGTISLDDVDIYGMTIDGLDKFLRMAIFSNGGEIIKEDLTSGLGDPEALEALEFAAKLKKSKTVKTAAYLEFSEGKSLFAAYDSWIGTVNLPGFETTLPTFTLDDYGFFSFPTGPKADKDEISSFVYVGRRLNWLVNSGNDMDNFGLVLDFVFQPLDGTEKQAWKKTAKTIIFHHPEDFTNFERMIENPKYDYSVQLWDSKAKIDNALTKVFNGSATPSAEMDSIKEIVETEMKKALEAESNLT